jgi:hypothetical protein
MNVALIGVVGGGDAHCAGRHLRCGVPFADSAQRPQRPQPGRYTYQPVVQHRVDSRCAGTLSATSTAVQPLDRATARRNAARCHCRSGNSGVRYPRPDSLPTVRRLPSLSARCLAMSSLRSTDARTRTGYANIDAVDIHPRAHGRSCRRHLWHRRWFTAESDPRRPGDARR